VRLRIERTIRAIPRGKVLTYGGVARAAGIPGSTAGCGGFAAWIWIALAAGAGGGGEIKLQGDSAVEQRLRLEAEGVRFRGKRVT